MNNDRRKRISAIVTELAMMTAAVENLRDEEQEAFDALPDGLKDSPQGNTSEVAIEQLEAAFTSLEEAVGSLQEIEGVS